MRRISPTGFRIARRGTSREINGKIALNLIRERQPISRAELARLMGLRRGGISRLVDDLLAAGLVFEGPKGESRRGRKPMHLHIETRQRCVVAVDIRASRTSIMLTDVLGNPLLDAVEFRTRRQPATAVEEMVRRIRRMLEQHPELGSCVGVGIAMSGLMDLEAGRVRFSPTIGWRDVDLASPLQAALKLPVVVENSCKACVLAEVWAVRGDAPVDGPVAFVNVSDGVGVGIAIDGKLLRGARNVAGEFGHVPLSADTGPRCSCGQRGCWETYVSKRAIVARYLGKDASWPESADLRDVSLEEIIERARGGDRRALDALSETGRHLGRGFATIIKTIDPRRIYLGGEITAAWDLVAPMVEQALQADALIRDVGDTEILIVGLGEQARLRGAAALVSTPAFAAPVVS